jgi:molybdopterin adenylyltransferase
VIEQCIRAAVITASDSSAQGIRADLSGPAVAEVLRERGYEVVSTEIVADEMELLQAALIRLSDSASLVVTTGGTGLAPRDVTPEATRSVCSRIIDGLAERMRNEGTKKTPYAALSRGVCGIRGRSLIVNLPGSPTAARESLLAIIDLIPHSIELLAGKTDHQPK